jgi:anti-sigma B factor antagonist
MYSNPMRLKKKQIGPGIVVLEMTERIASGRDCERIREEVDRLIRENQRRVIFDLSGVHYMDSAGVASIVRSLCSLKNAGAALRLAGAKGMVQGVLRLTHVDRVIPIYPTTSEACQDVTPSQDPDPPR